jgi:hypothetical protein
MKNFNDDDQKSNRKKNFQPKKKKIFIDEDTKFINKSNKEFKHKRRSYLEEDDDWKNWDETEE